MRATLVLLSILTTIAMWSCTEKDEGSEANVQEDPYEKWDDNTAYVYEGTVPSNPDAVLKAEIVPGTQIVIDGRTYNEYKAGFVASKDDDLAALTTATATGTASVDEDGTVYISSFEGNGAVATLVGVPELNVFSGETVTFDPPMVINMDEMKVGETRNATISVNVAEISVPVTVSYGPVEDGVTLMTAMGPVQGCRKYHVSGSFEYEGFPMTGTTIEGNGYYHPSLGLVGWEAPDLGIGMTMSGTTNFGDATEGFNIIQKTDVLRGGHASFTLDTYDRIGQFDADKNTHAKMLLELRWADPDVAQTHDAPHDLMAPVTFGTMGGLYYFPHELLESPVSVFFPEENGNGFRYWYAFVDQAAKNQSENGISYTIKVDKDTTLPDLRVTARIGYTILPAGAY